MKRTLGALALILALALGIGLTPDPASAHNQDNNSLWACAATRPTADYSVDHSWWTHLYDGIAQGRCMVHNVWTGGHVCYLVSWYVNEGRFQGFGYDYGDCWFDPHET